MRKSLFGFSLIEVMVATLLMGMLGTMLMTSINTSLKAKDSVEEISGRYHEVRQALSRMAREISMAYLSKHIYLPDPAYITQFKGKNESLYFSAFGNIVRQKDAKQSDQQVLGFYLAQDKQGRQSLMRSHHANLNLDVEKDGRAQVLCSNVSKLTFAYYDDRSEKWEESWLSDPLLAASQSQENKKEEDKQQQQAVGSPKPWRLPRYVKITLTVPMIEGTEMTWVSETEIPLEEPLDLN